MTEFLKRIISALIVVSIVIITGGCGGESDNTTDNTSSPKPTEKGTVSGDNLNTDNDSDNNSNSNSNSTIPADINVTNTSTATAQDSYVIEAEASEYYEASIANTLNEFSGDGYVTDFAYAPSHVKFAVNLENTLSYDLRVVINAPDSKTSLTSQIYLDGQKINDIYYEGTGKFETITIKKNYSIDAGEHVLVISGNPKDIAIDYLYIEPAKEPVKAVTIEPEVDKMNLSVNTKKVYSYLLQNYGKHIISGQQASADEGGLIDKLLEMTGKSPAIRGFDFSDYSPSRVQYGAVGKDTDSAIEWWKSGGIVTFCWHWNAPKDLINDSENPWWSGFYTKATTFDLSYAMSNRDSEDFELLVRDIDVIAEQLKRLQEEDVPVLWRPLHEAYAQQWGGWFWWGAKGKDAYIELWRYMHDRLTNYHKLNNLIWVWNGQHKDWYPGDEYVDIMSEDIYQDSHDYSSQKSRFDYCKSATSADKIIALSENGVIPDPDNLKNDGIAWSWFCTWAGEFVIDENGDYNEKYTGLDMLKKVYTHEYVITKDELPSFISGDSQNLTYDLMELVQSMEPGWNLGNTLDAASTEETAWGNPKITQNLIKEIKDAGFNSIRLPITWDKRMQTTEPYLIDGSFLIRVKTIVDWALDAGLVIIINMHHDSTWLHNMPDEHDTDLARFSEAWVQIADFFKDYPETLIFEGINEPRFSDDWNLDTDEFFACTRDLNMAFVNIVRSSGGNNVQRPLILATVTNSASEARLRELQKTLAELNDNALLTTFHYYGHYHFSVNTGGVTTFNKDVQNDIINTFDRVSKMFIENGIPVILGEYGLLGFDSNVDTINHAESMKYFDYVTYYARQKGIVTMLWDNGQHYDRVNSIWRDEYLHQTIVSNTNSGGLRSSNAEKEYLYLKKGEEVTDTSIKLQLNGNTLKDIIYEGSALTNDTQYILDGETLIFKEAFLREVYINETGVCAPLILEFSAGADWQLNITVYDEMVLEPLNASTSAYDIPVQFNGNRVTTIEAVYANGGNAGPGSWTSFKEFGTAFTVDYSKNLFKLKKDMFNEVRDNDRVIVKIYLLSGDVIGYSFTKNGNNVTGEPYELK